MTSFVQIAPLNGRRAFMDLAEKLEEGGYDGRVEYFAGGWQDKEVDMIAPHLKFACEDDALAFVLTYGGKVTNEVPIKKAQHLQGE